MLLMPTPQLDRADSSATSLRTSFGLRGDFSCLEPDTLKPRQGGAKRFEIARRHPSGEPHHGKRDHLPDLVVWNRSERFEQGSLVCPRASDSGRYQQSHVRFGGNLQASDQRGS